jgi:hypothetical protein
MNIQTLTTGTCFQIKIDNPRNATYNFPLQDNNNNAAHPTNQSRKPSGK